MRGVQDNNFIELYICWTITVFGFIEYRSSSCVTERQNDEILFVFNEWIYL